MIVKSTLAPSGIYPELAYQLLLAPRVDVGEVHAMKLSDPNWITLELQNVVIEILEVPVTDLHWQERTLPNLPWAEEHFQERVSGEPMNPPPSAERWPFATGANAGNERHKKDGKFSHTYPERFWPRFAERGDFEPGRRGIRFRYGDLDDLVKLLRRNPLTRQAYLPVWFPEDLAAAWQEHRVPCTLGYHFMARQHGGSDYVLHCNYYLRSCDFVRYFRDDVYMAGRLMQWISAQLNHANVQARPGSLTLHVSSLHAFVGDEFKLKEIADEHAAP